MTKTSRKSLPGVLETDRGSSSVATKQARAIEISEAAEREDARQGLRELDSMTERLPLVHEDVKQSRVLCTHITSTIRLNYFH